MRRLRSFAALAALAARELVAQPIFVLLTTSAVALTALCPLATVFHFGEEGKLARDGGLAFQLLFGLLIAVQAGSATVAEELERGTAAAVLSKPVGRAAFFLGKFAGVAAVLFGFSLALALTTLLSERVAEKFCATPQLFGYFTDWQTGNMLLAAPALALGGAALLNYLRRRSFGAAAFGLLLAALAAVLILSGGFDRAGRPAPYDLQVQWRLLPAHALVFLALLALAAGALALSTRLQRAPTLACVLLVLAVGMAADHALGRAAAASRAAAVAYALTPNWQHFWVADGLDRGGVIPLGYLARAAGYGVLYTSGLLCLGVAAFRHAEVR